jgi:glycosyltransferase involved in cell wall biosynthesis
MPMLISVVSPVYQAEKIVPELVLELKQHLDSITSEYEIILVNDGSTDFSWEIILKECELDTRIIGVNLSRNWGQHYAISAGLKYARGEWIVVMDCDLQDRPDEIVNLLKKAEGGWDIVRARRINRQDKFVKQLTSKLFHYIYSYLSDVKTDHTIANFGIYKNRVISEFNKMTEESRSFSSLLDHLGFRRTTLNVKHSPRHEGDSTYTFEKLITLTFNVIVSNSNKPLKLAIKMGLYISFASFAIAAYNLIAHNLGFIKIPGFTSTIFSIWFIGGLIILNLGILGMYISKIFDQVKSRQIYIIAEEINTINNQKNTLKTNEISSFN